MVDISVVNSYILHRDTPHASKFTIKEFILELATELMSLHTFLHLVPYILYRI